MRLRLPNGLIAVAMCLLSISGACAEGSGTSTPRVFLPGELTLDRYTVVQRLWVEPWRSAVSIPTQEDRTAAISELLAEAGKFGADGVVNLFCLKDRPMSPSGKNSFFCYGNAVKLK